MKSFAFPAFVAALGFSALCSCSRLQDCGPCPEVGDTLMGTVVFSLEGASSVSVHSKAEIADADDSINDIQVLVFDSLGSLAAYGSASGTGVSLRVPCGVPGYKVRVAVNADADFSNTLSVSAFDNTISSLSNNAPGDLEMSGALDDQTFTSGTPVTVPATRFASKIMIDKVTPDFASPAYRNMEFKVLDIFLVNVNGTCPFSLTPTSGTWYNQMKAVPGGCDALVTRSGINSVATPQSPYSEKQTFYCYPNPAQSDSQSETFSPRFTRLVVKASVGGTSYFYPVSITGESGIQPNMKYEITDLRITGPGSSSPDKPVSNSSVSFSITAKDWTPGFTQSIEY